MKRIARVFEIIGALIAGIGCYLVFKNTLIAVAVAYIGLAAILLGAHIESRIWDERES